MHENLNQLKTAGSEVQANLEGFAAPEHVAVVELVSSELTSHCPVTHQPDYYTVTIVYEPDAKCLETKSLKTYLMTFRDTSEFCEYMSQRIAEDIFEAIEPHEVSVTLEQQVRGGVALTSTAVVTKEQDDAK